MMVAARGTPSSSPSVELGVWLAGCDDAVVKVVGGMPVMELCDVVGVEELLGAEIDMLEEEEKPGVSVVLGNITGVATLSSELDCPSRLTVTNGYGSSAVVRFVEQHFDSPSCFPAQHQLLPLASHRLTSK